MLRFLLVAAFAAFASPVCWAQTGNPSFNLVNRATSTINELYASPAGMTNWGRDRLGNNNLPPGQTFPVRLPADGNCIYDVRVVYANGQSDERRGVNTCSADSVAFPAPATAPAGRTRGQPSAGDPSFRLVNRGRSDVNEVYASPSGEDNWGQDRLGDDTVSPGSTRVVRLPQGQCTYDVRIVYANGEATEKRRLNLCTITDLRVP